MARHGRNAAEHQETHIVFFGRSKSVVGLDIGSSAVKAVELKTAGKGYRVSAFAVEPVPADSIVDGAIIDSSAVTEAVRRLLANMQFRSKEVATSLSGHAVIVKKIAVPLMSEAELAESIYWEAEQYIPFDIQDVSLDYEVIDPGTDAGAQGTMQVLVVAAKKDKIADYTNAIAQAGRTAAVVDVDAFAFQNAYEANYGVDKARLVALLNLGASAINVNIVSGGQSVFTRDISMGGNTFTEALQRELSLSFDTAERLKKGQSVEGASIDDARPVFKAITEQLLLEIEKTLDFFKSTAGDTPLGAIVLSGGASRIEGFADAMKERFSVAVEQFDPFRQVAFDAERLGVNRDDAAPVVAIALGLALRRVGDR
ncbi:MAG: type IV pilus assembly protein PilM [Acidobacteriota bacterium]